MRSLTQPLPSLDRLYDLFRPNFMRGELTWRVDKGSKRIGDRAGNPDGKGYTRVTIDRRGYFLHRLLYAMYHGADPGIDKEVDHIDMDQSDSRVANLRLATGSQNSQNRRNHRDGLKGAYRNSSATSKANKPWVSTITNNGIRTFLGMFDTEEDAHEAYAKASLLHHGEFGRTR